MSISKRYIKSRDVYRIDFTLSDYAQDHATKVSIVGDFNGWHSEKDMMKKEKSSRFTGTIELPAGKDYQFRYLIDNYNWETDWDADGLAKTPYYETYNSVIKCTERINSPE
jgi:1,4-alpha-glucan branching enzyme